MFVGLQADATVEADAIGEILRVGAALMQVAPAGVRLGIDIHADDLFVRLPFGQQLAALATGYGDNS
ncbi:hypothetical protein K8U54_07675 [Pseudomonas fulva]|uniref:hypothetical protein n=1 Tax=Pseudomonas fulva TaxID=47880 RepID=UPI00201E28CC|nr:hypothetical protein [Pseudomonas fulva]UQY36349.1 hypothetical protein K8U54_07675 [Pseudomonas fulva]